MNYSAGMESRALLVAALLAATLVPPVASAETEAPCSFRLSPPQLVQLSGTTVVTATVDPAGCSVAAEPTLSVACVQLVGSTTAERCAQTEGPGTARVYYAPYHPGASYTSSGRGCASVGNPPRSLCQSTGPITAAL